MIKDSFRQLKETTNALPKLTVQFKNDPSKNREIDCKNGDNVFELLHQDKASVDTACVGKGTCGLCRIKILSGEDNLNPIGPLDEKHLGNVYFLTKIRLACQSMIQGDVTIEPQLKANRKKSGK